MPLASPHSGAAAGQAPGRTQLLQMIGRAPETSAFGRSTVIEPIPIPRYSRSAGSPDRRRGSRVWRATSASPNAAPARGRPGRHGAPRPLADWRPTDSRTAISGTSLSRPIRSVRAGITCCASATIARSARCIIGACGSAFTATTRSQRAIPADAAARPRFRTPDSRRGSTTRARSPDLTVTRQVTQIADDPTGPFPRHQARTRGDETRPSPRLRPRR